MTQCHVDRLAKTPELAAGPCNPKPRQQRGKDEFGRLKRMLRRAEREAGDGTPIGGTGATILKFLAAPLVRLADRKRIGTEEIRAADDIAIASKPNRAR